MIVSPSSEVPVGPAVRIFAAGPIPPLTGALAKSVVQYVGCDHAETESVIGTTHGAVLYARR